MSRVDDGSHTGGTGTSAAEPGSFAAALALAASGDPEALSLLYERVAGGSPAEVREAASAIAELRDPRSLGPLLEALRRAQGDEKCHLVRALGTLGDARALPPLLGLMSYGLCETDVIEALGRIGDERALGALVKALRDERADVCSAAIDALGALGDPRTEDVLRACLDRSDADPAMQLRVEHAVAAIRTRDGRST